VLALVFLGCSDDDGGEASGGETDADPTTLVNRVGDPVELGDDASFLVALAPQESDGGTLVVDEVVLTDSPGFVVIYDDGDGAPGRQLGVSSVLPAGRSTNVPVELDVPLEEDAVVHAMVHLDDDADGTFGFPESDAPATVDGRIVEVAADVTVTQ
jgi:hypothetical protein